MTPKKREALLSELERLRAAAANLRGLIHAVNVQMEAIAFQPENWESYMYSWLDRYDWIVSLERVQRRINHIYAEYPELSPAPKKP